jgi:hypothetical protein
MVAGIFASAAIAYAIYWIGKKGGWESMEKTASPIGAADCHFRDY